MSHYDELLSKISRKSENKNKKSEDYKDYEDLSDREQEQKHEKATDSKKDKKYKSTIDREGIDYYAILGVKANADVKQIKRAYHKRLRKYHPDYVKDKTDKDSVKKNKEKYKLINEAYNVLKDELKRKAYDTGKKFEATHSKGFDAQKNSFKDFMKLQEQNMTEEDKKLSKLKFEMSHKEMNAKHGYDDSKEDAIPEEEYSRRVEDMMLQRDQEEIDIQHKNLFEGRQFNPSEFNKVFNKQKKRDKKRSKTGGLVTINDNEGIMAFNDGMDSAFANVDSYNDLYSNGSYTGVSDNFAGVGDGLVNNINSDDDISIDSEDIEDNYDTHNKDTSKDKMDEQFQRAMAERQMQNTQFENMDMKEYGSALDDKFGISKDFGFMVGNDKFGHQVGQQKSKNKKSGKDKSKAVLEAYKELTEK
jgi:curved DNA-binding protein CbpA